MRKNILKYILLTTLVLAILITYLSLVGIETKKFNNQIKNKIIEKNNKLNIELKKIKLTLDPINFKINAKTIGAKIIYKKKHLELEYIKTQISLNSLIKNKFVSSDLIISTRSIFLKDLITFIRVTINRPELFILEQTVKKGHVIVNAKLNIDNNGNIKNDFEVNGLLKDGRINLFKNYNFDKINFNLNIKNGVVYLKDTSFVTNKINFFSENLKIIKGKKNILFEGEIQNKNSILNDKLVNFIKLNSKNFNFINTKFSSKNNFSFSINDKFKLKDLVLDSEIIVNESEYKKHSLLNKFLPKVNDKINLKDHKIKFLYKKNYFSAKGKGGIKLQNNFEEIEYSIIKKGKNFNLISNISLSELNIKNQLFLKNFFPNINETIDLKDHKIKIKYNQKNLSFNGSGKIKLDKEFNNINYYFLTNGNDFDFDTNLDLHKTSLKIDNLNFNKDNQSKATLSILGNYNNHELILNKVSILSKNDKIILRNLSLDKENKINTIDKIDLDYIDNEYKKNQIIIRRVKNNNYELNGSIFNANSLISDLLKNETEKKFKIFKNNININLNLSETYIDDKNLLKNLKGKLHIENNKIVEANISALFDDNENFTFSINTNNGEKVTTLFSSRAKPLVQRYKFIKGFKDSKDGYLDFFSSKKDGVSNSKLVIDNFKVREIPALAKLLALASLQGIADLLTGEGIRFTDFEMKFTNQKKLMKIEELYAIGPAISILMEGYIEGEKLISLRGTLVPATTINRSIASIPLIGDLLIGKKVGEGVFGVSFKIKGPPKELETTVNPIKTLTPRFITRTLEKIKKN